MALVAGPPGQALSLHDRAHLAKSLVDLAASHHPYDPLEGRLRGIWAAAAAAAQPGAGGEQAGPEAELQAAAWAALQVVQGEVAAGLPAEACEQPQRCHADGCCNSTEGEDAEVCGMCGVAVFCSPRCARAGRLGRHASCVLEALSGGGRLGGGTALYLAALMASGRHWVHRLRALRQLALNLGAPQDGSVHTSTAPQQARGPLPWGPDDEDEGTGDNLPPPHIPGVAEIRAVGASGVAPALAALLADVAEQGVARRPWPAHWQWLEDPLPEWGLGSAVPRVVHLINMLTSERPPGCGGVVVWSEGELQRHAAQLARCTGPADAEAPASSGAAGGGPSGGSGEVVMRGYTELCFNAAADFPCPAARASCLDAAVTLHALAVKAPHAALRAAAAGALRHLSAAGLQALLARPPQRGGGGGGGGGSSRSGRREVGLGCGLQLMTMALLAERQGQGQGQAMGQQQPAGGASAAGVAGSSGAGAGGSLAPALQGEWSRLLSAVGQVCGGTSTAPGPRQVLLGALADLVAACRRQGLLRPEQLQAAEALLQSHGVAVSIASASGGTELPKPAPAPVAPAAASARPASPAVRAAAAGTAALARAGSGSPEPGVKVCAACGAAAGAPGVTRLRKCSRCQAVRYCSEACQMAHWTAGHKRECKQLAAALAAAAAAAAGGGPVEVD